jgi:hypothetical protein
MENNNAAPEAVKTPEEELKKETTPVVENAPVETKEEEMVSISKVQLETMLATTEEITKIAEKKASDAENYKKGMLAAKGKLKDNGLEEEEPREAISAENLAEVVKQAVAEQMATITPAKVEDDELTKANKKMEEMRRAFANSSQISSANTSMGSNQEKPEVKTSYFSKEDEAELRMRAARIGVDPDKFIKQVADSASSGAPGAWKPLESKRFNQ